MAKLSFFRTYFSITNYGYHKQICIMGIKIRIYDNERYKKIFMMIFLFKIIKFFSRLLMEHILVTLNI